MGEHAVVTPKSCRKRLIAPMTRHRSPSMRYWWIGFVGIMAACSGQSGPGPVLPSSTGSPLTGTAGATSLSTVLDSLGIPDSSVGDTALLVADLNDERRQEA